jgi:hypothetical protein
MLLPGKDCKGLEFVRIKKAEPTADSECYFRYRKVQHISVPLRPEIHGDTGNSSFQSIQQFSNQCENKSDGILSTFSCFWSGRYLNHGSIFPHKAGLIHVAHPS